MAIPYGNRQYRVDVLSALQTRSVEELNAMAHEALATEAHDALTFLGLDPMDIEEMLDVPTDEETVFCCEYKAPKVKEDPIGTFRQLFSGRRRDCQFVVHMERRPMEDEQVFCEEHAPPSMEKKEPPRVEDASGRQWEERVGPAAKNPVSTQAAHYRATFPAPCATRGDVEMLLVVATTIERELDTYIRQLNGQGEHLATRLATNDLMRMLKNLQAGKPIETGVGR